MKTPTTTVLSSPLPKSTAFTSPVPATASATRCSLERFGVPGKTLIGSDSHTPTGGGIGMLAFGAGGLDVAVAMGGGAYYITMPKMVRINLTGKLHPWVTRQGRNP